MNCQEVMELMQRQLDDDLSDAEMEALMEHNGHCPDCAAMFERLKRLSAELIALPKVTPSYSLVDAILPELERIELLGQHRGVVLYSSEPVILPETNTKSRRIQRQRRWSVFGSVVAAGIVVGIFLLNAPTDMSRSNMDTASSNSLALQSDAAASGDSSQNDNMSDNLDEIEEVDLRLLTTGSVTDEHVEPEEGNHRVAGEDLRALNKDDNRIADTPATNDVSPDVVQGSNTDSMESTSGSTPDPGHIPGQIKDKVSVIDQYGVGQTPGNGLMTDPGTGEPEIESAGQVGGDNSITTSPDNGIAAFEQYISPDGLFAALVQPFEISIVSIESGDTVMTTSRKNGHYSHIQWSEDGKQLFYEVQLDQGSIEKYVINTLQWEEKKETP